MEQLFVVHDKKSKKVDRVGVSDEHSPTVRIGHQAYTLLARIEDGGSRGRFALATGNDVAVMALAAIMLVGLTEKQKEAIRASVPEFIVL